MMRTNEVAAVRTSGRKGILLAGGCGTRLHPCTAALSKQLLPVYDKPMIYYPLATLMMSGAREILLVSTPHDLPLYQRLFGDGSQLGIELSYAEQPRPEGIAQAFILARQFLGRSPAVLALGDNLFFGHGLGTDLARAARNASGATIFVYHVRDPERYGVVDLDEHGQVHSIEEKPGRPRSHLAVVGLYFYDSRVAELAAELRPSARGELEITDLNRKYLEAGSLHAVRLGRGTAWLDTGTCEALHQAANFIEAVQTRQGLMVACIEEVAFRMGYISLEGLSRLATRHGTSAYGAYLSQVVHSEGRP